MRIRVRSLLLAGLGLVVLLVLALITLVGWEVVFGPDMRPATDRTFVPTPERVARGEYLVAVAACFHCHSEHEVSSPELPMVEAKRGGGWIMPIPELGTLPAPNLTPDVETGLGAWSDDEIARAIQEGVSRDGRALFPIMPYMNLRHLDDEDLASIVVHLRTLPAVRNELPDRQLIFPLNLLVNTMPEPLTAPAAAPAPARVTDEARGEYLVRTVIGCQDCHTPMDTQGQPLPGLAFAGGAMFSDPALGRPVFSKNITPDASGIAHYDEAMFGAMMRTGQVGGNLLSHIMPFESYQHLTEEDMHAIYSYLRTLPPVQHRVSNTDPPTLCPLCGQAHGLGDLNVARTSE